MSNDKFRAVFDELKKILKAYESKMKVVADTEDHYYLETFKIYPKNKLPIFFGATQIKKNYVSYYLMPVYACPELLEGISVDLKKRMQGKSCFNFKERNEKLLEELKDLTEKGFKKYESKQLI